MSQEVQIGASQDIRGCFRHANRWSSQLHLGCICDKPDDTFISSRECRILTLNIKKKTVLEVWIWIKNVTYEEGLVSCFKICIQMTYMIESVKRVNIKKEKRWKTKANGENGKKKHKRQNERGSVKLGVNKNNWIGKKWQISESETSKRRKFRDSKHFIGKSILTVSIGFS